MSTSKSQPRIIIFTSGGCSWCGAARRYFREHGFRFREVDVAKDADAARDLARRGIRGVPFILINNRPIHGFDKEKINRLLGIR